MWAPLVRVAFGLSWAAHMASSKSIASRQEQCAAATSDAEQSACAMQAAFGGSSIIPQILPDFAPKAALSVKYGDVVIGGAQQMSPSKVATQPFLSLTFISNNPQLLQRTYLILGLEYQPKSKLVTPFWLQSSVKIDKATGDMTSPVAPMVKYKSPNPSQGSGTHEYIFLVFQDPGLEALSQRNPQIAAMISGAPDFKPFLASLEPSNSVIAGSFFKSTFDGIPVPSVPATPKEKVPQSPPATTRAANQSTDVQPDATVRN